LSEYWLAYFLVSFKKTQEPDIQGPLTGNADGIGETRKKEIVKSAKILGIRSAEDVLVVDDPYAVKSFKYHAPGLTTYEGTSPTP